MKNHFNTFINYNGKNLEVKVQCLSNELPEIIYTIWPMDKELKNTFKGVKQFYFHISSKLNKNNILEITHNVVYDYKTKENNIKDVDFEFGVWNSLLTLNI